MPSLSRRVAPTVLGAVVVLAAACLGSGTSYPAAAGGAENAIATSRGGGSPPAPSNVGTRGTDTTPPGRAGRQPSARGTDGDGPFAPPTSAAACRRRLARAGVSVAAYEGRGVELVDQALTLEGPIGGVRFRGGGRTPWSNALDCRLAVALLAWSQRLDDAGVASVRHYSLLRPGARVNGSGRVSGHAKGLAIDVGKLRMDDGRIIEVLEDWPRRRGAPPCPDPPAQSSEEGRLLVELVCGAVADGLFQMLISPNHDQDHRNHIHLEVVPGRDEAFFVH